MLANVVTPDPANDAPEKSFVAPASPVFDTSVRMPPLVVAPPNGVAVAASAAGTMTVASTIAAAVVISRLMESPLVVAPSVHGTRSTTPRAFPIAPRPSGPERNPYEAPATDETYAATSSICVSESWPLKGGIAPLPFVTRSTTRVAGGFA